MSELNTVYMENQIRKYIENASRLGRYGNIEIDDLRLINSQRFLGYTLDIQCTLNMDGKLESIPYTIHYSLSDNRSGYKQERSFLMDYKHEILEKAFCKHEERIKSNISKSVRKRKLDKDIKNYKQSIEDEIKKIQEKYQEKIDNEIARELPFKCGDILKRPLYENIRDFRVIYTIYKGIKNEHIITEECDENGNSTNLEKKYPWNEFKEFQIYKKAENKR